MWKDFLTNLFKYFFLFDCITFENGEMKQIFLLS
jgi:hypothetical protein